MNKKAIPGYIVLIIFAVFAAYIIYRNLKPTPAAGSSQTTGSSASGPQAAGNQGSGERPANRPQAETQQAPGDKTTGSQSAGSKEGGERLAGGSQGDASSTTRQRPAGASGSQTTEARPNGGSRPNNGAPGSAVEAVMVKRANLDMTVKLSGEVQAARTLKAFPTVAGTFTGPAVKIGDRVAQGDLLGKVDPSRPGSRFEPSPVFAPIAGTVTILPVEAGANVTTTTAIAELASLDELDVIVRVPEKFAVSVVQGTRAEISLSALGSRLFQASARSVDPVLDPATRSKRVLFRLSGDLSRVSPGMFAETRIVLSRSSGALVAPLDSIISRSGKDLVYVVENNVAHERNVRVGLFTDADAEILEGLREGELVISRGQNLIRDGSAVKLIARNGS